MVTVNGIPYEPNPGETVLQLVAEHTHHDLTDDGNPRDGSRLGIAVAIDSRVIPRSAWVHTEVHGAVEIVTAVQGG